MHGKIAIVYADRRRETWAYGQRACLLRIRDHGAAAHASRRVRVSNARVFFSVSGVRLRARLRLFGANGGQRGAALRLVGRRWAAAAAQPLKLI